MLKRKIKKNSVVPIVFPKSKNIFLEKSCPICSKDYENNHISLPCGHTFHSGCVLTWFEKKMNCPICRIDVAWTTILPEHSAK